MKSSPQRLTLFAAAIALTGAVLVPGTFLSSTGGPLALAAGALLAGVALALRTGARLAWDGAACALGAYFGWAALSLALRGGDARALGAQACGALLFAAVRSVNFDRPARQRLLEGVVLIATLAAALAVLEALGLPQPWSVYQRPGAMLGNRNWLAEVLAIALPVAIARALMRPGVTRTASVALVSLALLLTRSRAAWLAVAGAAVLAAALFLLARTKGAAFPAPRRLVGVALALGLSVAATCLPWPGLYWRDDAPYWATATRLVDFEQGAGAMRVARQALAVSVARAHPLLGVGPGRWAEEGRGESSYSQYLQLAAESGLPTLVAAIVLALSLFARGGRQLLALATGWPETLGSLAALCVLGFLCLVDTPLGRLAPIVLAAVLGGALGPGRPRLDFGSLRRSFFAAALLVCVALVCAFVALTLRPRSAESDLGRQSMAANREVIGASLPAVEPLARAAAAEVGLPAALLLAIAYSESRFTMLGNRERLWISFKQWRGSWPEARNPALATARLGVSNEQVSADPALGLRAAALLIAEAGAKAGVLPGAGLAAAASLPTAEDAAAWTTALKRWSGTFDALSNELYADQILQLLSFGFEGQDDAGRPIRVAPRPTPFSRMTWPPRPSDVTGAAFVPFASVIETSSRRPVRPRPVRYVVLHTTQGDFSSSLAYFRRPSTGVGSHYLVRSADGLAVQMIDERAVAFHDACFNELSIGIELEGIVDAGDRWYGEALYRASARLVRDIARRHGIPLDRAHILGHAETPDCSQHMDPGPYWDWDHFMQLVAEPEPARLEPAP